METITHTDFGLWVVSLAKQTNKQTKHTVENRTLKYNPKLNLHASKNLSL